jgi:hypothetical protein
VVIALAPMDKHRASSLSTRFSAKPVPCCNCGATSYEIVATGTWGARIQTEQMSFVVRRLNAALCKNLLAIRLSQLTVFG